MARLKEKYSAEIVPQMMSSFKYKNTHQVPKLEKITLNMGVGEAKQNSKMLEAATEQLAQIAGQQPSVRLARKSIASFKLREGMPVGVAVTLRRERMYEMLDRLVSIAIPRFRDFRGLNPRSFDGRGNYSMGIGEQIVFPEIDYDAIDQTRGLNVTITTSAASDEEAFELLKLFGMPFRGDLPGAGVSEEDEEEKKAEEQRKAKAEAEKAAAEALAESEPKAEEGENGGAEEGKGEDGDGEDGGKESDKSESEQGAASDDAGDADDSESGGEH